MLNFTRGEIMSEFYSEPTPQEVNIIPAPVEITEAEYEEAYRVQRWVEAFSNATHCTVRVQAPPVVYGVETDLVNSFALNELTAQDQREKQEFDQTLSSLDFDFEFNENPESL